MTDEEEFKKDIKLQEEEEKPTSSFNKNTIQQMMRDEIRNVIKEMLIDNEPITPTPKKIDNSFKKEPENNDEKEIKQKPTMQDIVDSIPIEETPKRVLSNPSQSQSTVVVHKESEIIENDPDDPTPIGLEDLPAPDDTPPEINEWDEYESQKAVADYIDSEWSHKSYLLSTKFVDKDTLKLHDLVLKELSLSNLPDTEIAFIYSVKMDCIEEWLAMGFYDLAKQRLVHMLFRLRLMTSVEGLELIAQHGSSAISMSMDRMMPERDALPEDESQGKKPSIGLKKIINKLRR
jgi:hypothetical protein